MLAERGVDVSYETVRRWFLKFGPGIAANLRRTRPKPSDYWHLDEMAVTINGKRYWLWRAVDNEGEVLDFLVQSRRNAKVAKKLMTKLLKKQGFAPTRIVTDRLRSYATAFRSLNLTATHDHGLPHQPVRRRERKQQRFKSPGSAQRFLVHSPSTTSVTCSAGQTTSNFGPVRSMHGPSHPPRTGVQPPLTRSHAVKLKFETLCGRIALFCGRFFLFSSLCLQSRCGL